MGHQAVMAESTGASQIQTTVAAIPLEWEADHLADTLGAQIAVASTEPISPEASSHIGPPDSPRLTASAGSEQVKLTWNVPDDGGSNLKKYVILGEGGFGGLFPIRELPANTRTATIACSPYLSCSTQTTVNGTGDTVTATLSGLRNGQEYNFVVYAKSTRIGYWSNTVTVTPFDVPGPPKFLSGTRGDDSIMLKWEAPDGQTQIDSYVVAVRIGSLNPFVERGQTTAPTTTFKLENLDTYTPYTITVYAVNKAGSGAMSNMITLTIIPHPIVN